MSRRKGLSKTGGRVRGTPNKATNALAWKLAQLECDPIEGLARIALDPATETALKVRCFAELAQYIYPKRKAVDLVSAEDSVVEVRVKMVGPPFDFGNLADAETDCESARTTLLIPRGDIAKVTTV